MFPPFSKWVFTATNRFPCTDRHYSSDAQTSNAERPQRSGTSYLGNEVYGILREVPSAVTDMGLTRAVSRSIHNHLTIRLILKLKKPLPSQRTFEGHKSNNAVPDASQVQRTPLNLVTLDGRDRSRDESPSPTLSYLMIPSDETEQGSEPSSPTGFTLLDSPPPRSRSRLSFQPASPSPLARSYVPQQSPPMPDATRPVTPVSTREPTSFMDHGPTAKTSSLSRGYVIVQPFTQSSPELAVRSTPLLITLSDFSTEESEDSTSSGEDFLYPISPDPLPTISPPVAQFANLRTADAPMRSPSPPPAQHTFVTVGKYFQKWTCREFRADSKYV